MKLNTELQRPKKVVKLLYFFVILFLIGIGWVINLKPNSVSDVNVQLSLFAMEKGYQGVVRMNSGERVYTAIDYVKKIVSSPKNLNNISIKSLETIYIEIPFEEQVKLNSEITKSLNFNQSNEREDIDVKGEIRENLQNTIDIKINLKGNGLDHIQYKDKESIKIELENSLYQDMSEFSLQHPLVRDFQLEPMFMYVANNYGIITTDLKLINLNINGKNHGIFEIEEVGTKEHLERSGKLNSVVLRFEAPRYRGLIGGPVAASGRAVTYRTAMFDTLNTRKINQNLQLREYKVIAKGKFRAYLERRVRASEVFDAKLIGSYIAISEIFGAIHPLIFHNFLFYYNPESGLLEPIAYDASLHQRYAHSSKITTITDGFVEELLYDPEIFKYYSSTIYELSNDLLEGDLLNKLLEIENSWYKFLIKEFWLLEKLNVEDFLIRPKSFSEKSLESLASNSSRKYTQESFYNPKCEELKTLDNVSTNLFEYKLNNYELVKSEFYKDSDCVVLKIWSTAFDQPEQFNNIKIIALEVESVDKVLIYNINETLDVEESSKVNPGFPKIPRYKLFKISNINTENIKVYYQDPISEKIVYVNADQILNY